MNEDAIEHQDKLATHVLQRAIGQWQAQLSKPKEASNAMFEVAIGIAQRMLQNVSSDLRLSPDDAIEVRASILALGVRNLESEKVIADMLKIKWPPNNFDYQKLLINEHGV